MERERQENPIGFDGAELGLGTAAWGDRLLWGHGRSHTDADLEAAFEASLAGGICLFDTAEIYGWGHSERLLGRFLDAGQSQPLVVTKFLPYPWRLHRTSLLATLHGSLDRLGLQQVDFYLVHWPFPPVSIETWMDGLADAVDAGLVRAVGISNFGLAQMERANAALARRGVPLAANQVEYSLLQRAPERNGLLAACQKMGVKLIAYSPLAMGTLTGKYRPDKPLPGLRGRRFNRRLAKITPLLELLREIGQGYGGKTPAQVALNWVIARGAIPIPGAKNARQAEENAGAIGWRLTEEEIAALDATSEETG
jgi:aryl-alcohol dehydrogenase-like predicted oxidoreductase